MNIQYLEKFAGNQDVGLETLLTIWRWQRDDTWKMIGGATFTTHPHDFITSSLLVDDSPTLCLLAVLAHMTFPHDEQI